MSRTHLPKLITVTDMAVSGLALGAVGLGALFVYSGLTGKSVLSAIANTVQGQSPTTAVAANSIAGTPVTIASSGTDIGGTGGSGTSVVNSTSAMAAMQQTAAQFGWGSGAEWTALNAIEMQEAGYDPTAENPTSHAYGLAQSLGHHYSGGPASNGINEYGGNGLTPAQSEQASLGQPGPQALWMMNYIKSRYGDPIAAEVFHLKNNYY
jgi:hypothetical protein